MNTPVKILLINYSGYYFILKLKYIFVGTSLQIECNYYQITNLNLINIFENTVKDNPDNEQIIKTIPTSLLVNIFLSQHRALEIYYILNHLIQANSSNFDVNQLYEVKIDTITSYLNIIQINILKSFFEPFCNNYEGIKISLQTIIQNSPKEVKVLETNNEIINQPTAESTVLKPADYIEEILMNLSSSKIINRFIIKCLEDNDSYYEEIQNNNYTTIRLTPLIKLGLTGFSILHFKNIAEMIELLDPQESFSKLMATSRDITAVIKDKEMSNYDKSISLQILTFLIFIYGIKLGSNKMLSNNISFEYPLNLKRYYGTSINNYFKKYIISIKDKAPDVPYIQFEFVEDSSKLIEMNSLNVTIQKYRYLLNIDKESFIQNVFNTDFRTNKKETNVNDKLLFTEPKILCITKFIEDENSESNYLLAYKNINSKYQGHHVISEPYLHLLHIHYQSSLITLNQIKVHPVISKYCDILLNRIYKSLTSDFREMLKYTNSTLVILEKYIRPFIKDESSKIELFLLYQVLIPMIYDLDQSKIEYIDYFL